MLEIKIKYFTDIEKVEQISVGDWIDLRAAEDVSMAVGDFKLIPLGIAIQLPGGYEAHVVPRSSTYKKWKIIQANHMGVIDESYCGDNDQWMFPAIALENTIIHKGDRICQFRIIEHQPELRFVEVSKLCNEDRGGFGSTGDK